MKHDVAIRASAESIVNVKSGRAKRELLERFQYCSITAFVFGDGRKKPMLCPVLSCPVLIVVVVALSGYQSHAHCNAIVSVPNPIPVFIIASHVV
jgi:hypothetical protein